MSSDISSSRPLEESAFSVRQKSVAYSMNLNKVTKILQFSLTGTLINVRSQSIQLLLRQFSQKPQMSTLARVTGKVMGSSKSLGLILWAPGITLPNVKCNRIHKKKKKSKTHAIALKKIREL